MSGEVGDARKALAEKNTCGHHPTEAPSLACKKAPEHTDEYHQDGLLTWPVHPTTLTIETERI